MIYKLKQMIEQQLIQQLLGNILVALNYVFDQGAD